MLAKKAGALIALDSASIVGVIGRLKTRGLVSTNCSTEDRHRVLITLIQSGKKLLAKAMAAGLRANELTLAPLAARERQQLITLLARLIPAEDD
jgi:DNA-binding MarR family transcriptional regulator